MKRQDPVEPGPEPEVHELLHAHAQQLRETMGLDSVSIVATCVVDGVTTRRFSGGAGNFYASIGATRERLREMEAIDHGLEPD